LFLKFQRVPNGPGLQLGRMKFKALIASRSTTLVQVQCYSRLP
jgi:hypothetical protein